MHQLIFVIDYELQKPKEVLGPFKKDYPAKRVAKSKAQSAPKANGSYCSCVLYAKSQTGFTQSVGAARNWPINSSVPYVGGVVVTWESNAGHVAIIAAIEGNTLFLREANYSHCQVTTRTLDINSSVIKGYWISKS